jgi:hypothetical protein
MLFLYTNIPIKTERKSKRGCNQKNRNKRQRKRKRTDLRDGALR